MRGDDMQQEAMFSCLPPETQVPQDHPLRPIRKMLIHALAELDGKFQAMYAREGRLSIPPEKLLRALLLQVFYTIRSARRLMEQGTLIEAWACLKSFRSKDSRLRRRRRSQPGSGFSW